MMTWHRIDNKLTSPEKTALNNTTHAVTRPTPRMPKPLTEPPATRAPRSSVSAGPAVIVDDTDDSADWIDEEDTGDDSDNEHDDSEDSDDSSNSERCSDLIDSDDSEDGKWLVSYLGRRGGRGGGRGGSRGAGRGARGGDGNGRVVGACFRCGEPGHRARECTADDNDDEDEGNAARVAVVKKKDKGRAPPPPPPYSRPPPPAYAPPASALLAAPVATIKDPTAQLAFLFDVANLVNSSKRYLCMPLNELAAFLPSLMFASADFIPTTPAPSPASPLAVRFARAVAVDGTVNRNDQGAGAMNNLHAKMRALGVDVSVYSPKGFVTGHSAVQRAVDVALGVELLDLCDTLRPEAADSAVHAGGGGGGGGGGDGVRPAAAAAADSQSTSPAVTQATLVMGPCTAMHVVLFSSDGDLEPAVDAALRRNPLLRLTVVYDERSTSQSYLRWLREPVRARRLRCLSLSALAAQATAALNALSPSSPSWSPASGGGGAGTNNNNRGSGADDGAADGAAEGAVASSPLGAQSIVEVRRRDHKTTDQWVAAIVSGLVALDVAGPSERVVLRLNQDDFLFDGDLIALASRLAAGGCARDATAAAKSAATAAPPFLECIRQLWVDHTGVCSSPAGARALAEICAALPNLREVHMSDTKITAAGFNVLCAASISLGRAALYINAASTPASAAPEVATRGFAVAGKFDSKTVKISAGGDSDRLGTGSVNARFVGQYREREVARVAASSSQRQQQHATSTAAPPSHGSRGAARGGRGGGRAGNGACYKCFEVGHKARDCPVGGDDDDDTRIEDLLPPPPSCEAVTQGVRGRGGRGRAGPTVAESRGGRARGRGGVSSDTRRRGLPVGSDDDDDDCDGDDDACFNCGRSGHFARDCDVVARGDIRGGGRGARGARGARGGRGGRGGHDGALIDPFIYQRGGGGSGGGSRARRY